ncbi:MAG: hypothetical protein HY608_05175 [Planctomycetes bacterium]|nr:hypothetical protein [Planctomycetota bacterium]
MIPPAPVPGGRSAIDPPATSGASAVRAEPVRAAPAPAAAPRPDAAESVSLLRRIAQMLSEASPQAAEEAFGRFLTAALEKRQQSQDRSQGAQAVLGLDDLRGRVVDDLWNRLKDRLDRHERDLRASVERLVDKRLDLILQRLLHSKEWGTQVVAVARGEAQAVRKDLERILEKQRPSGVPAEVESAIDDLLTSTALSDRVEAIVQRAASASKPAAQPTPEEVLRKAVSDPRWGEEVARRVEAAVRERLPGAVAETVAATVATSVAAAMAEKARAEPPAAPPQPTAPVVMTEPDPEALHAAMISVVGGALEGFDLDARVSQALGRLDPFAAPRRALEDLPGRVAQEVRSAIHEAGVVSVPDDASPRAPLDDFEHLLRERLVKAIGEAVEALKP